MYVFDCLDDNGESGHVALAHGILLSCSVLLSVYILYCNVLFSSLYPIYVYSVSA